MSNSSGTEKQSLAGGPEDGNRALGDRNGALGDRNRALGDRALGHGGNIREAEEWLRAGSTQGVTICQVMPQDSEFPIRCIIIYLWPPNTLPWRGWRRTALFLESLREESPAAANHHHHHHVYGMFRLSLLHNWQDSWLKSAIQEQAAVWLWAPPDTPITSANGAASSPTWPSITYLGYPVVLIEPGHRRGGYLNISAAWQTTDNKLKGQAEQEVQLGDRPQPFLIHRSAAKDTRGQEVAAPKMVNLNNMPNTSFLDSGRIRASLGRSLNSISTG
ncbi:hypothetical protein EYF80_013049 [Liparis tanakae]|uniref:Uncharacterized protein n=1 Tax=Liparis tanakae TaxID=230148 RepID=A0A4Z2IFW1_9TELE|nr:hypothetical protein EYF80_013049 [Liparis tanakae]